MDRMIPRLKLRAAPDGTLISSHERVDDGWWQSVLHDRRARVPTALRIEPDDPDARYRLDRQQPLFPIGCACGQHDVLDRDVLIPQVGGEMNVNHLAKHMLDCKRRNKVTNGCMARVIR